MSLFFRFDKVFLEIKAKNWDGLKILKIAVFWKHDSRFFYHHAFCHFRGDFSIPQTKLSLETLSLNLSHITYIISRNPLISDLSMIVPYFVKLSSFFCRVTDHSFLWFSNHHRMHNKTMHRFFRNCFSLLRKLNFSLYKRQK